MGLEPCSSCCLCGFLALLTQLFQAVSTCSARRVSDSSVARGIFDLQSFPLGCSLET